MKLTTSLESMKGAISACLRCSGCTYSAWPQNRSFCPLYERGRTFTESAGGLLYLARAVLNGQMDFTPALADLAYTCTACGACDGKCVIVRCINPDMALSDILRLIRYEAVKRDVLPEGPIKDMYEKAKTQGDLVGNGAAERVEVPTGVEDRDAGTLMTVNATRPEDARSLRAALSLLSKMKRSVALYVDAGSAGSNLYDFGFWDELPALVERKWAEVQSFEKKKLLFLDPHRQEFMTNKYEKILDNFPGFEGQHFSELLQEAFEKGELKSKRGKKVRVSYHDPCFLGRGLGIYDAPRSVLTSLKGVEIVEMKRHKENSFCCGARGLGGHFKDFSARTPAVGTSPTAKIGMNPTVKARIDEFLDTGADLLITACSYCNRTFKKAMGSEGDRVKDLTEFVNERTHGLQ